MKGWSLRSRLFVLIVIPLILVATFAAVGRFILAERMSERLYDNTLLAVALTISRDVVLSEGDILAEQLLDRLSTSLGDPVYYRIIGPGGRFVTGYSDAPDRPADLTVEKGVPVFFDSVVLDEEVRVVALEEFISEPQFGGWVTVEVWQTVGQRERLTLSLLYQSLAIMGLVIATAAVLVWFGIYRGLKPLTDLEQAVRLRSPDDLRPISRAIPEEIRNLVAAMNALFGRLERAFADRDAFVADAAHQLRNPVAAIQAQTESLLSLQDRSELDDRVASLANSARQMSRLTQQLLTLEKARIGFDNKRSDLIDLTALTRNATARMAERHSRQGIEFEFAQSGTAVPIFGDAVLIEEAVVNLIHNAVVYGCRNGGQISVTVAFGPEQAAITVTDDGPGIPTDMRERVFDRFFRGNEDGTDGSGLGLAIARSIAEAHGGTVELIHTARGASVRLTLSLE